MGVDFFAYSHVRMVPFPKEHRVTRKAYPYSPMVGSPDLVAFGNVLVGARFDEFTHQFCVMPKCDISEETEKWLESFETDPTFIGACPARNVLYFKTPETEEDKIYASYSGYGERCDALRKVKAVNYLPPCTDSAPECGYLSADRALVVYNYLTSIPREILQIMQPYYYEWIIGFENLCRLASEGGVMTIG